MKDDFVGSCLIELQSLPLSNLYFGVFSNDFVHCNSGIRQVVLNFFLLINENRIYGRKEHRMPPFLDVFPARNQSRLGDGV